VDLTPGAFPVYSLHSAYGEATPLNLEYQRAARVVPLPFHFLNNKEMNIQPNHYSWPNFYAHVVDLASHTFSPRAITRRIGGTSGAIPRFMNVVRALSSEGHGRIAYNKSVLDQFHSVPQFRQFFENGNTDLPRFYSDQVRQDLGDMWQWLPPGAMHHDPNAYLQSMRTEVRAEPPYRGGGR
jgi:hypothetical protein